LFASSIVYLGLAAAVLGCACGVRPIRRLRIATRGRAAIVAMGGLAVAGMAAAFPTRESRVRVVSTHLDRFAPAWHFSERHTIRIAAPPPRVFEAIRRVTADEILLFRTLTWIRRGGRNLQPGILNAGGHEPLIDVAVRGGFVRLADDAPRELVIGAVVMAPPGARGTLTPAPFQQTLPPGFAVASMNFLVAPDGPDGSLVSTETRVFASSPASRRRFAAYWRVIYPGSAIIRRMWLRAIRHRATVPPTATTMDHRLRTLVEKVWYYHQLNHQLSKADAILVLCSHDKAVAETGARLYLDRWSPLLIFSGGLGSITRHLWAAPEADQFAEIAIGMGVPRQDILIENRSTNTGENVLFTKQLLAERQLDPCKFIVVQKPYMERRSYATFRKVWPDKEVLVTSPKVSLDEYFARYSHAALSAHDVISIMVGDLQRIKLYPAKGFQIEQEIPDDVWAAYDELVEMGYNSRLV
jgi:uncharacterized SAM-binding protein YcdF (DUF218 family)